MCLSYCKRCMLAPWQLYSLKHHMVYLGTVHLWQHNYKRTQDTKPGANYVVNRQTFHDAKKKLRILDLKCLFRGILKSRVWTFKLFPFISSLIISVINYFSSSVMWKIWAVPPKLPLSQTRVSVGCWLIVYNVSGGNKQLRQKHKSSKTFSGSARVSRAEKGGNASIG